MQLLKLVVFLFAIIVMSSSCERDPQIIDVRDQAEGIYDFEIKYYDVSRNYLGSQFDQIATITLEKNDNDPDRIDFTQRGLVVFYGTKIEIDDNGFKFDISSQTYEEEDTTTISSGIEYFKLGSASYHGEYTKDNNTEIISIVFLNTITYDDQSLRVISTFDGLKN